MAKWHPNTRVVACDGTCEMCSGKSCALQLELFPVPPKKRNRLLALLDSILKAFGND